VVELVSAEWKSGKPRRRGQKPSQRIRSNWKTKEDEFFRSFKRVQFGVLGLNAWPNEEEGAGESKSISLSAFGERGRSESVGITNNLSAAAVPVTLSSQFTCRFHPRIHEMGASPLLLPYLTDRTIVKVKPAFT
jgi:hypothetical protein